MEGEDKSVQNVDGLCNEERHQLVCAQGVESYTGLSHDIDGVKVLQFHFDGQHGIEKWHVDVLESVRRKPGLERLYPPEVRPLFNCLDVRVRPVNIGVDMVAIGVLIRPR